jgi:protein involved in polysaccharide export with SLBB domain
LMPNDVLTIRVLGEQDLTVEKRVADDGKITYPFLETIDVKGKTPAEVEKIIHDGLAKDYLVNPQVMVDVKLYTSLKVNVMGSVSRPGPVELPPERRIDVLEAVGMAGDFTRLAQKNKIEVRRNGETIKFKFDELKNADPAKRFYLQPDDVIYVPERVL